MASVGSIGFHIMGLRTRLGFYEGGRHMIAVLDNNSHKFRFLAWLRLEDSTRQKLQKKRGGAP